MSSSFWHGKSTLTLCCNDIDIRVSLGAAVFPSDGENLDTLLGAADTGMYLDKKQQKRNTAVKAVDSTPDTPYS